MTYCVGLRTDRGIFIAADSVFSSENLSEASASIGVTTAFGERQGDVGPRRFKNVSEEGLKLVVGADSVIGFAGHVAIAKALVSAYQEGRALGRDARNAVHNAVVSVSPCKDDADVLFAFYENGKPCLLHVKTACASTLEVNGLIQLGSELPSGQHRWTAQVVSNYLELLDRLGSHPIHVERIFSQLVAVLQSYGVHDYLLPHGVGGAFVAAWVTQHGARWQGDHLYVIHGEMPAMEDAMCATMVRDDVLCLVNNQTGANKSITTRRLNESMSEAKSRSDSAIEGVVERWDSATFDYLISINTIKHIVTILEMCQKQHHDLLSLHAPQIDGRLGIVWTEAFVQLANKIEGVDSPDPGHMSFKFLPFKELSKEEQVAREQFAWEQFVEWGD